MAVSESSVNALDGLECEDLESPLPSRIYDWLFVGNAHHASDLLLLEQLGITHVVDAAALTHNLYKDLDIKLMQLKINDQPSETISDYFPDVVGFLRQVKVSGGKALVHCQKGVSRSVTLVLAYMISEESMSLQEALSLVQRRRPTACPNMGFWQQLMDYAKQFHRPPRMSVRAPSAQGVIENWISSHDERGLVVGFRAVLADGASAVQQLTALLKRCVEKPEAYRRGLAAALAILLHEDACSVGDLLRALKVVKERIPDLVLDTPFAERYVNEMLCIIKEKVEDDAIPNEIGSWSEWRAGRKTTA